MTGFLAGALGLVILQVALSSPLTAPRLGQLGTDISHAVARFVDPTVPLIGSSSSSSTASTTAATTAAPSAVLIPNAQVSPGLTTYTALN